MQKRWIRRAFSALGAFAVLASMLALGSSPARASGDGYDWHYPEANCTSSTISFTVGGVAGITGVPLAGGSQTYSIHAFCPAAGYTLGAKVWDDAANKYVYNAPAYDGPAFENLPGVEIDIPGVDDGAQQDVDRAAQFQQYKDDLDKLGHDIYVGLGSPPQTADTIWQWWSATEAAANAQQAADQINQSFSQRLPAEAVANLVQTCSYWPWGTLIGCWDPRFNGLARLRNEPASTPRQNWYWMNNWLWQGWQGINGNLTGSWTPYGWAAGTNGTALGAAGCGHTDMGQATGLADAVSTHQVWRASSVFGCGIAGGTAQGAGFMLTGVAIEYQGDWWGGQLNS